MFKSDRDEFINNEIKQYADDVKCLFETLLNKGFDETEAFQILIVTLKNSK